MRIFMLAVLAVAISAFASPADAAKSGAKNASNSRICASIRSDFRHKGAAYVPAGVTCGKKRRVV